MRGVYTQLLDNWPEKIEHNHSDIEKEIRYRVGESRMQLLRNYAEPFAYRACPESGVEYAAYLHQLAIGDFHSDMPENIAYEYVCGSKEASELRFRVFAYIWFSCRHDAIRYTERKGMTIQGGWKND